MTRPTIRTELAAAVRAVNAAYNRLPESERPEVEWDGVDDALELVLNNDNRGKAEAAIRTWRDHWLEKLGGTR